MHHCLNASIPQHLYGFVDKQILHGMDPAYKGQYEPCVIFGATSIPSRCLHFSIMCESGSQWARIPIHMLRWEIPLKGIKNHELNELQMWDNHGWDFSTVQYEYLREMCCTYRQRKGNTVDGQYWFTLDHTDNGFSQYPPEHKCYHVILLRDGSGQIAAQPNNRIVWKDFSFVKPAETKYKVMASTTWHAESSGINPQNTALTQD